MKSIMESVVASITSRIGDVVKDVADLKASLQFSRQDISLSRREDKDNRRRCLQSPGDIQQTISEDRLPRKLK